MIAHAPLHAAEAAHARHTHWDPTDLMEVTLALGAEMLLVGGLARDPAAARALLDGLISSCEALERFARIIEAQGGNPRVVDDPAVLP